MSNKNYYYLSDGITKPHTLVNKYRSSKEVFDRLSLIILRENYNNEQHFLELTKEDWKNIFRAEKILAETIIYGDGAYMDSGEGSPKIWAMRLRMEKELEEIEKLEKLQTEKEFLIYRLSELGEERFLSKEEKKGIKEVLDSFSQRVSAKSANLSSEDNLFDTLLKNSFRQRFEKRPKDADENLEWQKSILLMAKEYNTPTAWIYAANVIALANDNEYYQPSNNFLLK